jgi:hypothetical protein
MANEVDRELSDKYCPRFGQIAVEKGYVTADQVKEALAEQIDDDIADRSHRLIGRIFLDKGVMTPAQIDEVLNEVFSREEAL